MSRAVKVAYLTNQYPKSSHTFVRREIAGLEEAGLEVARISVRAVDEPLVDESDRAERTRTRVLLARGVLGLVPEALAACAFRPLRTLRALRTAITMGRASPRGLARHLAYLAEACVLRDWLERLGVEHVHAHFSTNPAAVALLEPLEGLAGGDHGSAGAAPAGDRHARGRDRRAGRAGGVRLAGVSGLRARAGRAMREVLTRPIAELEAMG